MSANDRDCIMLIRIDASTDYTGFRHHQSYILYLYKSLLHSKSQFYHSSRLRGFIISDQATNDRFDANQTRDCLDVRWIDCKTILLTNTIKRFVYIMICRSRLDSLDTEDCMALHIFAEVVSLLSSCPCLSNLSSS